MVSKTCINVVCISIFLAAAFANDEGPGHRSLTVSPVEEPDKNTVGGSDVVVVNNGHMAHTIARTVGGGFGAKDTDTIDEPTKKPKVDPKSHVKIEGWTNYHQAVLKDAGIEKPIEKSDKDEAPDHKVPKGSVPEVLRPLQEDANKIIEEDAESFKKAPKTGKKGKEWMTWKSGLPKGMREGRSIDSEAQHEAQKEIDEKNGIPDLGDEDDEDDEEDEDKHESEHTPPNVQEAYKKEEKKLGEHVPEHQKPDVSDDNSGVEHDQKEHVHDVGDDVDEKKLQEESHKDIVKYADKVVNKVVTGKAANKKAAKKAPKKAAKKAAEAQVAKKAVAEQLKKENEDDLVVPELE